MKSVQNELEVMGKLLDVAALRHRVIAGNLANVNTPNYKRHEVKFEEMFNKVMKAGDSAEAKDVKPQLITDEVSPAREDGNNVVFEREVGDLMKNSLYFETLTHMLTKKINGIRNAISGRS